MSSLEYLVRPYQSPVPHGSIIIPATPTGSHQRATITWGAKATMPTPTDAGGTNVVCYDERSDEMSRTSETQRITGQDGESYVDVDRAKTVKLQKNEKKNCDNGLWNQMSGVAQGINGDLAQWASDFAEFDATAPAGKCHQTWNFANQASS
jgi:hypothetical protein